MSLILTDIILAINHYFQVERLLIPWTIIQILVALKKQFELIKLFAWNLFIHLHELTTSYNFNKVLGPWKTEQKTKKKPRKYYHLTSNTSQKSY